MSDPDGFGTLQMDEREVIGPYRIVGRMGAGGMGVVFAGVDADGVRAAVKVIHPQYASDAGFRARFAREVELLSRVRGPGVVTVLAADPEAAQPWLATEFVSGPTLAGYVGDSGPMSAAGLQALAIDLAGALAVIHRSGIVHRDLKPGNVILSAAGAKVLDFGIARAGDQSGLTGTGGLIGTPGWISPERYRGEEADAASDIFTWGALIAYASTGRPPFGVGDPEVLAYRIMSAEPDLSQVPTPLRELVRSALAKDRAVRPSVEALVASLASGRPSTAPTLVLGGGDHQQGDQHSKVPPFRRPMPHPVMLGAATLAVGLLVGLVYAVVSHDASPPPSTPVLAQTTSVTDDSAPPSTPTSDPGRSPKAEPTQSSRPIATSAPALTAPSAGQCPSDAKLIARAAAVNDGEIPSDSVIKRKMCSRDWIAFDIDSPSVGGVSVIVKLSGGFQVDADIGSHICGFTDEGTPMLAETAPPEIQSFLC